MGSSLEVSLVSLESSSILEESVSGWGDWEGRGGESGRDYVEPG